MNIRGKRKIKIILILIVLISIFSVLAFFGFLKNKNDEIKMLQEIAIQQTEDIIEVEIKDYNNTSEEEDKASSNNEIIVVLSKENCEYETQKEESITINQYKGTEDCIIIPTEIDGKKVENIDKEAFNECYNLETIKVPIELKNAITEIECFEVNEENTNEEYIELSTTREYSERYIAYMSLTEEEQENSLIVPYKFEAYATESGVSAASSDSLPSSYDLRNYIPVEVENQGRHGTCYAYATLTSLETWIAKNRGELVDFSEVHAGVYGNGAGGIFTDIENYINSSDGPVWEADWDKDNFENRLSSSDYNMINSYLSGTEYSDSNIAAMQSAMATKQVEGEIESKSYLFPKVDTIKEHILNYGSVCTYYYHDNAYLSTNYNGYTVYNYTGGITNFPDHAVSIIGWDDNFSKYNFPESIRPDENGAFLILNSWGSNWGTDGGCFWISYEDFWAAYTITGVTNVIGLGDEITLNEIIFKNADTGKEIEKIDKMKNLVKKGTNLEINLDLRYTSSNTLVSASEITVTVRNIIENVNTKATLSTENGYIVFYLDTKTFKPGADYIIDIAYKNEIISKTIRIRDDLWDYEVKSDNTIKLTAYNIENTIDVEVPQTYNGYTVTELGDRLFQSHSTIETIKVYNNVKSIGVNFAQKGIIIFGNTNSAIKTYASNNGYQFVKIGTENIVGDFWTFNIPTRTLDIDGKIGDYHYTATAPWYWFYRCIYKVNINTDIDRIGNYAFEECINLESVEDLYNVKEIGDHAFDGCAKLSSVGKLVNVVKIGDHAFANCSKIRTGGMLSNVTEIGINAFYKCTSLQYLDNLKNLKSIGERAFYQCTNLLSLENTTALESIGQQAFSGCSNLEYVSVLKNVNTIGYRAFWKCNKLKSVGTLENVKTIGKQAFYECNSLRNVKGLRNVTTIGAYAFYNCSGITIVGNLDNIVSIGEHAFDGCSSDKFNKITIGKTIETIGTSVFEGCDLIIYGYADTRSESYASEYSIPFVYINISTVEMGKVPNKTKYVLGDELDLTGGNLLVTYEDETTEEISMTDVAVTLTGYDKTLLGEQVLKLEYLGFKVDLKIKVISNIIIDDEGYASNIKLDIEEVEDQDGNTEKIKLIMNTSDNYINQVTGKIEYDEGISNVQINEKNGWTISFNLETFEFKAFKTQGAKDEEIAEIVYDTTNNETGKANISINDIKITTVDQETVSVKNISKEVIVEQIPTEDPEEDKSEVNNPEVDIPEEDKPEVDNPEVDIPEEDKPEVNNPEVDIPEEDKPEVDNPEVDVPEGDSTEISKILKDIVIKREPSKTQYIEGEIFNPEGIIITAQYSDGTQKNITNYTYTPGGELKDTNNIIVISYIEGSITKIIYYEITVEKKDDIDNNNSVNNNNVNNNSNINNNDNKLETEDNTTNLPGDFLPQTGIQKYIIIATIVLLTGIAVIFTVKYKKYKEI